MNILTIVIFIAAMGLLNQIFEDIKKKSKRKKEVKMEEDRKIDAIVSQVLSGTVPLGTRELFLETLTGIGCQYTLGEGEDNRIFFDFQGEHFFANVSDDASLIHIWDPCWVHVELYDIDEVARIKKAINTSNLNSTVTAVFTINEAGSTLEVHSKTTIPFLPTMPHLEDYLRVTLNEFFRAHQVVSYEMHKMREQERA